LGINVLPPGQKVCSFNCVYCQYGWTDPGLQDELAAVSFPPVEAILLAVAKDLLSLEEPPAYLTFSGHGEATLHPGFPELVDGICHLRSRFVPAARTAILSNSSRVHDPRIREALSSLDERIMKLDAGNESCLRRFNQPGRAVRFGTIVEGLRLLPAVTLQCLFAAGEAGNLDPGDVERWLDAVTSISPVKVQLYTLDRGFPSDAIAPAPPEVLESIAARLEARGIAARVF
jgi:wyosine [tRNA(Phe)-imidazoG37] synthetase (radical SAM superfamily)